MCKNAYHHILSPSGIVKLAQYHLELVVCSDMFYTIYLIFHSFLWRAFRKPRVSSHIIGISLFKRFV